MHTSMPTEDAYYPEVVLLLWLYSVLGLRYRQMLGASHHSLALVFHRPVLWPCGTCILRIISS
jgi:hypothetical protein